MASLSSQKKNLKKAVDYSWTSDMDTDHPECYHCGSKMDFYGHDENGDFYFGDGYWECDSCGFKIKEDEL